MSSIPKPHQEEKPIEEMESWEVVHDAIQRGESDNVATFLRKRGVKCSGQAVRSWRNDPDVVDDDDDDQKVIDPHGRRNPLDYFLLFLSAVGARSAEGAELILKKVNAEGAAIQADHGRKTLLQTQQANKKMVELAREIIAIADIDGGG